MTEILSQFHFVRPWWLLALIPIGLVCLLLWLKQHSSRQWQHFIAPHLLPFLLDKTEVRQRRWPIAALALALSLTTLALAGPVWRKMPQPVEQDVSALVICWDLSPSMLAEDIKPSRLERSRLKIIDLLNNRNEGQIALVAYSGEAYNVTPLSDDRDTIINLLPALSPTTLPTVGSNPEMALENAHKLLKDSGIARGHIMFITDEIDPVAFEYIENEMSASPHQLTLWAVGTKEGAPIPMPSGGFAKANGNMVVAKLNEKELLGLAQRTGAFYIPMQTLDGDIKTISKMLNNPLDHQTQRTSRVFDQWFEHGQYFAIVLLPFALLLFRKGWFFTLVLCLGSLSIPEKEAYASPLEHLWQTQDQKAQKELEAGNEEAAMDFTTPERRGAALYRQQKYEESAKQFAKGEEATDLYNLANALTQAGKYDEALEAYDKALSLQPGWDKAINNRDIAQQLAELRKQQNEQEPDQQQDGEQGDEQNQDQEKQQQEQNSDQQSQQDEQQDSQQQSDQSSSEEQNAQEEQDSAQQQNAENDNESAPEEDENPFSQAQEDQEQPEQAEQQHAQQQEEQDNTEAAEEQARQVPPPAQELSQEQSEEQQKLEQWLRKVPDDPSGLLRNKFQYEYNKRRQGMQNSTSYSSDDPEQRW